MDSSTRRFLFTVFNLVIFCLIKHIGADGGLDFGTVKVSEEVRLSVNLKNKGKYDIAYK